MVYFKDVIVSRRDFLVILDDEEQSVDKGTRLRVHTPIIGNFPKKWPKYTNQLYKAVWTREINASKTSKVWTLESAHHKPTKEISPLLTLGRRIAEGNAQWREKTEFPGEFRHFVGYWEWSEDVLSRLERELRHAGIYAPVYASLFTYDRSTEAIKAFCEAWCPSTNTLITPIDSISSLEHEIRTGFSSIKGFPHDFDLTQLEEDINTLFAAATAYDTARSLSHECGEDSIKKELADLEIRKGELMKSLEEHQALLRVIQQGVKNHEEEIEQVKNAPILDGEVLEELKNSEHQLQCAQRSLDDQDPFA